MKNKRNLKCPNTKAVKKDFNLSKISLNISTNHEVFNEACAPFQEALEKSGYDHKLVYAEPEKSHIKTQPQS